MRFRRMIDEARPDIDYWTEKEQARISTPESVAIVPQVHEWIAGKLDAMIPLQ
jgi:hypothetical protein